MSNLIWIKLFDTILYSILAAIKTDHFATSTVMVFSEDFFKHFLKKNQYMTKKKHNNPEFKSLIKHLE